MPDDQELQIVSKINLPASAGMLQTPDQVADYLTQLEREINGALRLLEQNIIQKIDTDDADYLDAFEELIVAQASTTTITITGADVTEYFPADRRVRLTRTDTGATQLGHVHYSTAATYSSGTNATTVTITLTSGTINAATDKVEIGSIGESNNVPYRGLSSDAEALAITVDVGSAAFTDTGTGAGQVPTQADIGQALPLGDAAVEDVGDVIGEIPLNTEASPLAELAYDDVPAYHFENKDDDSSSFISFSTTAAIPELTDIAVPGSPDGTKKYIVTVSISLSYNDANATAITPVNIALRMGSLGTASDPVMVGISSPLIGDTANAQAVISDWEVTPDSGDSITITVFVPANGTASANNFTVYGNGTNGSFSSWIKIEELHGQ